MNYVWPIFRREFATYFATPLAYVFIVIFLFATGSFTFYIGNFYTNGVADLTVFFGYHPLWATVVGKFLAAWAFTGIALALTFPIWLTVNFLGSPDNGVIFASYIGSFLMAGGYLAIGSAISATTSNQVIAFVVSVVVCFLFTISGAPLVLDFFHGWAPLFIINAVASFSFLTHFAAITAGVIDLRDVIFFFSLIALFLAANVVIVDLNRTG
jgi:ABC-2 type transport system permease protein